MKDQDFTPRIFAGESSDIMKKVLGVVIAVILLGFVLDKSVEPARPYFDIRSIGSTLQKDFAFIDLKYTCNIKKVERAELKIYALLKKGRDEKLASGTFTLNEIEKGSHKEAFMIMASHIKQHGGPRALRAEIWYRDKLYATKTKPSSSIKKKWWKKDTEDMMNIITRSDKQLRKLLRDEDD